MFYWIYDISSEELALLIAGVFVGFSWLGCIVVRPLLRAFIRSRADTNAIVGNALSCHGVFYGLLLGLLAVATYQNYADTQEVVAGEASALVALYEDFQAYPEPTRSYLRWLLRTYCRYVVEYAWPLQRQGIVPEEGRPRILVVQEQLLDFQPQNRGEEIAHAETLRQFNAYLQQRQRRLQAVGTGIPAVMWYVVVIGALINIALVWLLDMKFITQLFLGGLLAFFLGTMIFLVAALDNPFRGEVSVSPDALAAAHRIMLEDSY